MHAASFDANQIRDFVGTKWDKEIVPQLVDYIRIPNKSPMFDADWVKNGHMDRAVALMQAWAKAQPVPGMQVEVVHLHMRHCFLNLHAHSKMVYV